ncbi:Chloride transport protein 6 [Phytophthora pseudosyringae]|uniref:Chloride transport protein 6 n=1 Tax=Phytophthora pseudosyringae TaxID=221518 RepID=A0A8T1VUK5_9STRA|nr:Chloride transport protein 6 [Phytophthora pseudosyringae]
MSSPPTSGATRKSPRFAGIINRHHLAVLLQRKDFFIENPEPFVRTPASDTTLQYNDQYALSYRDMEGSYPRYPSINDIQLDDEERDLWMDITPYMNPTPHTVQEQTPVSRAFLRGVITRKDLTPAHLKFCLESLSETEKQRIQGYFHRDRCGSERFEDVEKKLISINDNS